MLLRLSLCAALVASLGACVTKEIRGPSAVGGADSEEINSAIERGELAVDAEGLISAPITTIISPTRIVINQRSVAQREVVFYGVSGPDKSKYPDVHADALGWLLDHAGKEYRVFVRPRPGADLKAKVIEGQVLLGAKDGGFLSVTQAMLSLGLLIYDKPEDVPDKGIQLGFRHKQKEAYDKQLGVWKYERGAPRED